MSLLNPKYPRLSSGDTINFRYPSLFAKIAKINARENFNFYSILQKKSQLQDRNSRSILTNVVKAILRTVAIPIF